MKLDFKEGNIISSCKAEARDVSLKVVDELRLALPVA